MRQNKNGTFNDLRILQFGRCNEGPCKSKKDHAWGCSTNICVSLGTEKLGTRPQLVNLSIWWTRWRVTSLEKHACLFSPLFSWNVRRLPRARRSSTACTQRWQLKTAPTLTSKNRVKDLEGPTTCRSSCARLSNGIQHKAT